MQGHGNVRCDRSQAAGFHGLVTRSDPSPLRQLSQLDVFHENQAPILPRRGLVVRASVVDRRKAVFRLLEAMGIVEISYPVLLRVAQPLPTALGTLDAHPFR